MATPWCEVPVVILLAVKHHGVLLAVIFMKYYFFSRMIYWSKLGFEYFDYSFCVLSVGFFVYIISYSNCKLESILIDDYISLLLLQLIKLPILLLQKQEKS